MASLTAKYRPRRFAEVAGQEAVKAILSRAAATSKIAPAYMFSGTRGVGKTTIARIFAKALNCEKAPAAEPCNECTMCRQANAGSAVDIIEIDAASHGGVNDVRALKEDVGYAPLEGRFKVFIIDEAHMLSTAAFNALLKTLEEPPARVTFILASTEAHKFPATILSRCQHYVFKMLPQAELAAHLEGILAREGVEYEPSAVRIIARRGAGSVRDSISLLGQALAYSTGVLKEGEVRSCLGLAGQEVFFSLMEAIHLRDLPLLSRTLRQVLDQGLDLGFFLRELSSCWRNMFLLRQAGEAILPELGLPAEEADLWMQWAQKFSPAHIHACWQMTLDGQQRVVKSLEPAQSLELLLLNLACLPDLLPLDALKGANVASGRGGGSSGSASGGAARGQSGSPSGSQSGISSASFIAPSAAAPSTAPVVATAPVAAASVVEAPVAASSVEQEHQASSPVAETAAPYVSAPQATPVAAPVATPRAAPSVESAAESAAESAPPVSSQAAAPVSKGVQSWEGFLEYVASRNGSGHVTGLSRAHGEMCGKELVIQCFNETHSNMLGKGDSLVRLMRHVSDYYGPEVTLTFTCEDREPVKTQTQLERESQDHPVVQRICEAFEVKSPVIVHPRGQN